MVAEYFTTLVKRKISAIGFLGFEASGNFLPRLATSAAYQAA